MMIEHSEYLAFPCPNCQELTIVYKIDINCGIFRHGVYRGSYYNINPHLSKKICEYLTRNELVYGCSKPFQILGEPGNYKVNKCDYI